MIHFFTQVARFQAGLILVEPQPGSWDLGAPGPAWLVLAAQVQALGVACILEAAHRVLVVLALVLREQVGQQRVPGTQRRIPVPTQRTA